jgi:hypothetical protein
VRRSGPRARAGNAGGRARGEIVGSVALERDRQDPIGRRADARLEQIDCALRQELGRASARPGDHAGAAGLAERTPSLGLEVLDSSRPPILREDARHD